MSTLRTACAADPRPLSRLRESIVFQGIVRVKGGEKRKKYRKKKKKEKNWRSIVSNFLDFDLFLEKETEEEMEDRFDRWIFAKGEGRCKKRGSCYYYYLEDFRINYKVIGDDGGLNVKSMFS